MDALTLVEVFVDGTPKGQPRPRAARMGAFVRLYDDGSAEPWRERVRLAVLHARPAQPFSGAFVLRLRFYFQRPKGHFGKKGLRRSAPAHHTSKPDADNLAKAIMDECTQLGFWRDDAQVHELHVTRAWTVGRPGCAITLARVAEEVAPTGSSEEAGRGLATMP